MPSRFVTPSFACALARATAVCAAALTALTLALSPTSAGARGFESNARHAFLLDFETGAVLLEKEADVPIPPASMSKLMTVALTFERLAQGRLSLGDRFPVSEAAFRKEGSTMFLNLTDRPTVEELLRGVIVVSGNDACIALAEGISGSERAFADEMTRRGREIGLTGSSFTNATGLPDDDHRMTARDLAVLAAHIIRSYPQYYGYYQETEFTWAGVEQPNRNPLLYLDGGGDGMKTGFTAEAGYGMVGTAVRGGRRLIAVATGLNTSGARAREIERMLAWGFREFEIRTIGRAGDVVGRADVWLGAEASVPLALADDLTVTYPLASRAVPTGRIVYEGPLEAPVMKGDPVGVLHVSIEGIAEIEIPVVAAETVDEGGYLVRLSAGLGLLFDAALALALD